MSKKQAKGFRCMDPEKVRAICAMGGAATHAQYGSEHMSKIGRKGRAQRTRNERKARRSSK